MMWYETPLMIFGGACLLAFLVVGVLLLVRWALDTIEEKVYTYKRKHRFKKPPQAKCYCRDCKKWNPISGECADTSNLRHMAAEWFCYFAEPMSKKEVDAQEGAEV